MKSSAALDKVRRHLQEQHLPVTKQRMLIASLLCSSHRHVSVDEIVERLRRERVVVGKATVYRTLALLVASGLAREHDFGEGFKRYEYLSGPADHEHLVCERCGKVIEFTCNELAMVKRELAKDYGFEARHHRLEVYGLCEDCRSSEAS